MTRLRATLELEAELVQQLAPAVVDALDDAVLDALAGRLAPRMAAPDASPATAGKARPMTVAEAATATGLHRQTVYRHLREGRLRGRRAGSQWRIWPDALDEYLGDGAAAPVPRRPRLRPVRGGRSDRGPLRALLDAERKAG